MKSFGHSKDNVVVLVSSAGRRVGLLNCFREDAIALGINLRIIATDSDPDLSAACSLADESFAVPRADNTEFVPRLLEISKRQSVDVIIPTIDSELQAFANSKREFAEIGTRVMVSDPKIVALARDKLATTLALDAAGVSVPSTASVDTLTGVFPAYPRIIKPRGGSSSKGIRFAHDPISFAKMKLNDDDIIQTVVVGDEYTVNMFFDQWGTLQAVVPHLRLETRSGEVSKAVTKRNEAMIDCARKVASALNGAKGVLCFQAKLGADEVPKVFEINARFGGGYPIAHAAGAEFSRWILEEVTDRKSSANDDWKDGKVMLRWDDAVFLR